MRKINNNRQNMEHLLSLFGQKVSEARRLYNKFVKEEASYGKRPELVGGGLIWSLGGWTFAKASRGTKDRIKGYERIPGEGSFVQEALGRFEKQMFSFKIKVW